MAVDQFSRAIVGFAVFAQLPTSAQVRKFLDRAVRASRSSSKYVVSDKGKQFWCRGFKTWCKRRGVRPRYGAIGQPASIALVERFIRSMKQECTRCVLVPLSLAAMRRELSLYATWFNTERPHTALAGKTPHEVCAASLNSLVEHSHLAFGTSDLEAVVRDVEILERYRPVSRILGRSRRARRSW